MYLKRLEAQGFKTFAQKTVLEFVLDASGRRGVTAIVGPNGSGKSNSADAIRWVMGEQSLKLLRGKKSEDVIFSGTDKRARSGFAEVTITLENDEKDTSGVSPDLEFSEVAITRRLYRDGQSEYEINKKPVRLQDVVMLLAQCGVGQRTYSVIGQGMVDAVLVASPSERKEFFDEAFGLKPFYIKRTQALNKMEEATNNLGQTETLLREIGPRLQSLEKQVKRLQERESLETELRGLERQFYGHSWHEISEGIRTAKGKLDIAQSELKVKEEDAAQLQTQFQSMEKAVPASQGFRELRMAIDALTIERNQWREKQMELNTKRAVAAVRAEKPWAPLPLSKIIDAVDRVREKQEELEALLDAKDLDLDALRKIAKELKTMSVDLLGKLQRPAPEPTKEPEADPAIEREAADIADKIATVAEAITEAEEKLDQWNRQEEEKRAHIFEVQRKLSQKRQEVQQLEHRASEASIELARLETRRESFFEDLRRFAPHLEQELDQLERGNGMVAEASQRIQRLRSQLEWIGGIDPETIKEYEETKERSDYLTKQTEDLRESLNSLELVVKELDATIKERSETAFKRLDQEFGAYFKKLFGGGEARLLEVFPEPELDERGNPLPMDEDEEMIAGIEIQATAPGKRNKSIALLSGGERALTSIALICAIMATNPSPFVVLDEVDAALDEANSRKFAEIIASLADKTQFIVVTHNRATMAEANVLYGVTMGDDGVSQLLSVKLEEVEKMRQKG